MSIPRESRSGASATVRSSAGFSPVWSGGSARTFFNPVAAPITCERTRRSDCATPTHSAHIWRASRRSIPLSTSPTLRRRPYCSRAVPSTRPIPPQGSRRGTRPQASRRRSRPIRQTTPSTRQRPRTHSLGWQPGYARGENLGFVDGWDLADRVRGLAGRVAVALDRQHDDRRRARDPRASGNRARVDGAAVRKRRRDRPGKDRDDRRTTRAGVRARALRQRTRHDWDGTSDDCRGRSGRLCSGRRRNSFRIRRRWAVVLREPAAGRAALAPVRCGSTRAIRIRRPAVHGDVEPTYVIEGTIELKVAGRGARRLGPGDGDTVLPDTPLLITNVGSTVARVLVMLSTPEGRPVQTSASPP